MGIPNALTVEQALWNGAIHFHYQPIVELKTRRLIGYEALARWEGYSTAQVIQAIEENGLVSVWIRCQIPEIAKALEQFPSDQFVALNLGHEALVEPALTRELENFSCPERLHLEILESVNLNLISVAILDQLSNRITVKADDIGLEFPWLDRLIGVYAKHFKGQKLCESLTRTRQAVATIKQHPQPLGQGWEVKIYRLENSTFGISPVKPDSTSDSTPQVGTP